jgi:hypothetical protein
MVEPALCSIANNAAHAIFSEPGMRAGSLPVSLFPWLGKAHRGPITRKGDNRLRLPPSHDPAGFCGLYRAYFDPLLIIFLTGDTGSFYDLGLMMDEEMIVWNRQTAQTKKDALKLNKADNRESFRAKQPAQCFH